MNDGQELQVDAQAARVQVAGAHDGAFLIGDEHLAVQHVALPFEDVETLAEQLEVKMPSSALHERHIAGSRYDDANEYAAAMRFQKFAQNPAEGKKVSHGQHQAAPGLAQDGAEDL